MPEYDVAIIGAGPGGYVAAIRAAQLGLSAVVIERDQVGGLCLNWGCIPSKALLQGADLLNLFRRAPEFGIAYRDLSADLGAAVDRSREIVARFVAGVETLLEQNKVALLRGTGRLDAPGRVVVQPASPAGRPGGEQVDARNVILASGGRARSLPGVELDGRVVITSREALASMFSARMPNCTLAPGFARRRACTAAGGWKRDPPAVTVRPSPSAETCPARKFIGGLPMKPPTKSLAGKSYTLSGVWHCKIAPSFITAIRSPRLSAST